MPGNQSASANHRSTRAGRIRPMEKADLEQVADLFVRTFRADRKAHRQRRIDEVASYMDQLYLQGPHSGDGVNSLVHMGPTGEIGGFLGLMKTRYTLAGSSLSTCVIGSLMAAKGAENSRVGAQLLWGLHDLDFDLIMTDSANRRSLAFGGPLKYHLLKMNCLEWVCSFQPAAMIAHKIRRRWPTAPFGLISPVQKVVDYVAVRALKSSAAFQSVDRSRCDTTTAADFAIAAQGFLRQFRLRPDWSPGEMSWLLERAEETNRDGPLIYSLVYDDHDSCIGCFAFYGKKSGAARVLQIAAAEGAWGATLECLLMKAKAMGCIGVIGQAQDALMRHLYRFPGIIFYYTGGSMARSRHDDVIREIDSNQMVVGGLAGDRWTRLSNGEF